MLVTERPGALKVPSLGATGMEMSWRKRACHCKLGPCRNAHGGITEVTVKSGVLQRTELGVRERETHSSSLWTLTPSARQEAGSNIMEGQRMLFRGLFYLKSPLLSLGSNSRQPGGKWLPGPQGKVTTCPQGASPELQGSCCLLEWGTM